MLSEDSGDVATAYYGHSTRLVARIADVLGRTEDAARYTALSEKVRAAWRAEFLDGEGRLTPDTQANHVRALAFDLVPAELRGRVAGRLVELVREAGNHPATGFLATPDLLPVLAGTGHLDVAYELLCQDSEPSWLVMIDRGATTLWEHWNGVSADGVPSHSLNHYSKGAVISFLHRYTAAIQLLEDSPAYQRFRIQPRPGGGITWVEAAHESPYGLIEANWRLDDHQLDLYVRVPAGTEAEVILPPTAIPRPSDRDHTAFRALFRSKTAPIRAICALRVQSSSEPLSCAISWARLAPHIRDSGLGMVHWTRRQPGAAASHERRFVSLQSTPVD